MTNRILVVDEDEQIGSCVRQSLGDTAHDVTTTATGEEAFFLACTQQFDLVIMDVCLGGRDGLSVLTALRARNATLPVLILSSRCDVDDRVAGLNAGADDYLTKPFSVAELKARIEALLRRGRPQAEQKLGVEDLSMDVALRKVKRASQTIELTALEFNLLELFMRRTPTVVSREIIVREIWNAVDRYTPFDNVIDVHMGRLRKKVDQPGFKPLIHTVRGVGYMLSNKEQW